MNNNPLDQEMSQLLGEKISTCILTLIMDGVTDDLPFYVLFNSISVISE